MTKLDIQTAKELCELLEEGKALDTIRKSVSHHGGTINAWIVDALLSTDLDTPLLQLRNAIIARVLKDTALLGMLQAASTPSENKSYKTTILSELSKSDKALLESQGYASFIKKVATHKIVLKVEETITVVAPDPQFIQRNIKGTRYDRDRKQDNSDAFQQNSPRPPPSVIRRHYDTIKIHQQHRRRI